MNRSPAARRQYNHRLLGVFIGLLLPLSYVHSVAELPPNLPGEEITDQVKQKSINLDSITAQTPAMLTESPNWLDEAMNTWEAQALAEQLVEDESAIPLGKGSLFIPTMTTSSREPEWEVLDSAGSMIKHGKTGTRLSLLPGNYFILMGNGSHRQRIVRPMKVTEGTTTPIIPTWSALTIDVVDESSMPYQGQYEIARIDKFEPYGRAFGPDPKLGEKAKTWILPPGTYKIFGVGESYNTLTNFVTVTLLPGRLTRFLLVQDIKDPMRKIIGGGEVVAKVNQVIDPNWKYGFDIGGSALLNVAIDHNTTVKTEGNRASATLMFNTWLRYLKGPIDWNTNLRIEEWPTIAWGSQKQDDSFYDLSISRDEARMPSLFLWRILPWAGPYGRLQLQTQFFPIIANAAQSEGKTHLYLYDAAEGSGRAEPAKTTIQTKPPLSPFIFESGIGFNVDLLNSHFFEGQFQSGFGYKLDYSRDGYTIIDEITDSVLLERDRTSIDSSLILQHVNGALNQSYGPEGTLNATVRIGNWVTATSKLHLFFAIAPKLLIDNPDIDWRTEISWRLSRSITLDYQYNYGRSHDLKLDRSTHSVQIRFSATSR